jgi:hypothetical protein
LQFETFRPYQVRAARTTALEETDTISLNVKQSAANFNSVEQNPYQSDVSAQLIMEFLAFYGTARFIIVFTTARRWGLPDSA